MAEGGEMTIDEAIEQNKAITLGLIRLYSRDKEATQLGIEALERLQTLRDILDTNLVKGLLPSETEGEK